MKLQRHMAFSWGILVLLVLGRPLLGLAARNQPVQYAEADIAYGARLYASQCSMCHGPNGDSIATVDLRSGRFRNATTDQQLNGVITSGIPGTVMPAFKLDGAELAGIVAYLRNMSTFDARGVPVGDRDRGRAVFEGKGGCTKCHRVDGLGAGLAPDLGNIGSLRTAAVLQTSVLDPTSGMMPINRPVRAMTRDGRVINGRRLNEDTYTVQLVDDQGRLVSLQKGDLREYTILTTSSMPPYQGKLTAGEVADLVAYLLSLKGA